jgi:hypothetical protein
MAVLAGDIAFLGVNSTDPDQFAILALKPIAAGDTFYVTDGGVTGNTGVASSFFHPSEGFLEYTAPTGGIAAGSVLLINAGGGNTPSVARNGGGSAGAVTLLANSNNATNNFSFSTSGDSLTAYSVSSGTHLTGTPNLIAFIGFGVSPYGAGSPQSSSTPTIPGGQVLVLANLDNAIFTNAANAYLQNISTLSTASNFTARDSTVVDLTTLSSGSISPVPTVNLSVSSNTGTEAGITVITVTATASSAVSGNQTVNLDVTGIGITTGDYTLSNNIITIADGATSGFVTFTVVDDTVVEGTEATILTISNPSSGLTLGSTVSQNIAIADNDSPSLVTTITIAGNATDLFPLNGGNGGANINRLGGFGSDLFYDYRQNVYYALVDRGPGGGVIDYQTRVEKFSITTDATTGAITSYQLLETIPFTIPAGTTLNGVTYATTTPFNGLNSKILNGNGSVLGLSQDPEGFVVGKNGNFFVSDEYGPSIYEFSPTGVFVRAFTAPNNVIPKSSGTPYYAGDDSPATTTGRQSNRGYEGLAISPDGTKLYAMFQDPLQEEGSGGSNPGRNSRNVRIVRYDVATGLSDAQYIYQLEALSDINDRIPGTTNDFSATAQGRNIGISSLVAINNNELLVLERDNRGIGVDPTSNLPIGSKRVYTINLTGATDVSSISLAGTNTLPAGVTPVSKTLFLDIAGALQNAGQTIPEKFEGLAIGPRLSDGTFSLILATDNDFSVTQNGSGTQFDVYYNGVSTTQVAIGSAAPTAPPGEPAYTLLPSYFYSFKTQANTLNPTPVFDFSTANYNVTEGNTSGFNTNATVRITRTGSISSTDTVQLQLSGGTANGSAAPPTIDTSQGPSSSATSYIIPTTPGSGVSVKSILTVGDSVNNKPDGTPYRMVGIPDGLGAYDNGDGTFTLLMNHEIGSTSGITRAHGGTGAFVSKWVINKSDLSVVNGSDLTQTVYVWNGTNFAQSTTTAFNRFCSGDLAAVSAFYNSATGLGSTARIYLNGEESGTEGRAFAHIATGTSAGTTYELPYLGKFSWENTVASPTLSNKTVVAGLDDSGGGQVYFYIGDKTNTGTEIDKAGLNNGNLYGLAVTGLASESNTTNLAPGSRFTLADLGKVQNTTGATLENQSVAAGVTAFLRPEDGHWDPSNLRDFYFVTTGSFSGPSRLWRLRFDDPTNPGLGGTIEAVLDGTEGQKMLDNMTIDNYGNILLQEDVGNNAHIGKIWQYNIATDSLKLIAQHDPNRFLSGSPNFLTQDEESSGIIDAQDILGPGWFLLDTQAHYNITGELVQGGQLQALFNPDTYNAYQTDYINTPITVTFAPGETYKDVQIPIAGDLIIESSETVNLSLVNPSSGTSVGTQQPTAVLTINDLNQAPTDLALSTTSINENIPANTVIGTFSSIDVNPGNTFTYSLVTGNSANDNSTFTINGNQLKINTSPDFETKSSYSIQVRTTDNGGLTFDKTLTININDVNEAPIVSNLIPSQRGENGQAFTYILPTNIFSDPEGKPLTLSTSGLPSWLSFNANTRTLTGTPSSTGTFAIAVQASDGVGNVSTNFSINVAAATVSQDLSSSNASQTITASAGSEVATYTTGSGDDTINASARTGVVTVYANAGNDNIWGGTGNDFLYGAAGNDTISGGLGADRLYGEDNDDILKGDAGNDLLYGGNGNDTLYGGLGSDNLWGNAGADIFVLEPGNGADTIRDYEDGIDKLGFSFGAVSCVQSAANAQIKLTSDGSLLATLINVNISVLNSSDFITVF